ncbi:hypothetical protein Tco_1006302 [Tanacetum coccineum]|uniref:Uncharacterized protein n=1 Tax=Tanacetum coccineum TaxID=301880 RepID=A0ABQ5FI78_9ASTR
MGELTFFLGLQVKQQPNGIFISQDKYVAEILKKFDFWSIRIATTPIESNKPLVKDEDGEDVDVHVYRSMIGSLMYLTASRPNIMFVVCVCARFQVTPKASYLNAVKRIFRYLKHQLKLGLWYPRDLPFELEAFSNSDYGGASLDRKSKTGGCQFLGRRLISWQCKKQSIVVNSTTEAEYIAAANCCGQSVPSVLVVNHTTNGHQFTKSNRHQELTSPKQTALSKANGLGKDFPNPFMAGSLPKTIKQSNDPPLSRGYTLGSGEDSLELKELMANCTQIVCFVRKKNREIHLKLDDAEGISSLSNEEIFVHLAHMSSKNTAWDQFSRNIATTLICLATSRRFIQLLLNKQQRLLLPHTRTYPTPTLTSKLFSNMRRASKGVVTKLNDRIDGLEKDLQQTKKTYSTALTKLVLRVKKLEYKLKSGKARRKAKIVLSDDEEIAEDSSNMG